MSAIPDPPARPTVIYDLGSNNGDDIPYYLLKADKVVAVEANPRLAAHIAQRFADEIAAGRVVVENCALTDDPNVGEVTFYIYDQQDGRSALHPAADELADFTPITVAAANIVDIVRRYGEPYYIKIDLEGFDHAVLKDLFLNGIFPPYISAEAHVVEVFCTLVSLGGYRAFKMIRSQSFEDLYARCTVETRTGPAEMRFSLMHNSGPFGNDIGGAWLDPVVFQRYLAHVGLGWNDIHASRLDAPSPDRVGMRSQLAAELLFQAGMRLKSRRILRWSRQLWGAA